MTKVFLTAKEVEVKKGYLSVKGDEMNPINDRKFIAEQLYAKYVITLAEEVKGKDFEGKEADDLAAIKQNVIKSISEEQDKEFVKSVTKPNRKLTDALKEEALAFITSMEDNGKIEVINACLNDQFSSISEFEDIGLFFEPGIVKLEKVYTMKEIIKAVKEVIDYL